MRYFYFFAIWTFITFNLFGQSSIYRDGDNLFAQGRYTEAFNIYSKLENIRLRDVVLKYKIGLCYLKSNNFKSKAIDYFNFCLKYQADKDIPITIYARLGEAYHYNYEFVKAINSFNTYLEKTDDPEQIKWAKRQIAICENALSMYGSTLKNIVVETMSYPANTSYNDRLPIIANEGNLLVQASDRPRNTVYLVRKTGDIGFTTESPTPYGIYFAYPRGIDWQMPDLLKVSPKKNVVPLCFKSNGQELLISISEDLADQTFYTIAYKSGNNWGAPKKLNKVINSDYREQGACFANSGQTIYFASNRPGGQGGYDLYKTDQKNNKWSSPQNLGSKVNSPFDELNPYVHTDQKTLYFSSDGHNTMGGFDIFKSVKFGYEWTRAQNVGYPVNTPFNETACRIATDTDVYVASDRHTKESIGNVDILRVKKINQKLSIAMVNGIIKVLKDKKSVPITLEVIDRATAKRQKYVYSPTDDSGRFFMILRNNRHYSLRILVDGEAIYSIAIDLPANAYNYQLDKIITLQTIKIFDAAIGQTVEVQKSKYKVIKHSDLSMPKQVRDIKYEALLLLMERIIERTDVLGLNNINSLEERTFEPVSRQDSKFNEDIYYTPMLDRIADIIEGNDTSKLRQLAEAEERYKNVKFNYLKTARADRFIILDHNLKYSERFKALASQDQEHLHELIELLRVQTKLHLEVHWNPQTDGQEVMDLSTKKILAELESLFDNKELSPNRYMIIKAARETPRRRAPAYYKQSELRLRVMQK